MVFFYNEVFMSETCSKEREKQYSKVVRQATKIRDHTDVYVSFCSL